MKDAKGHGSDRREAALARNAIIRAANQKKFSKPSPYAPLTTQIMSGQPPVAHQSEVRKVGGVSIERERDGTFSIYHAGNPYATTSGFKTSDEAARAVLRGR